MMKTRMDLSNWNRLEHYNFYKDFAEPYFGLTTQLDCTTLYRHAKENEESFFLRYMHASGWAVNQVENFRLRQEDEGVFKYDTIHISTTVGRPDNTFGFSFIPFQEKWESFLPTALQEVERVKNTSGLAITEKTNRLDTVHYSTIPWANFTSITNARQFSIPDSIPKILFGKCDKSSDRQLMSVAVYINHSLADAYHIGQYLEALQEVFHKPLP